MKTSAVKKCIRWLRSITQVDADPKKQSYMETITVCEELIDQAMDELEYLSVHYVHHFADSFAVVAYHHPESKVSGFAYALHKEVAVELFHFHPESRREFCHRHRDKIDGK